MTYKNIIIKKEIYNLLPVAEEIYRKHHPEMNGVPISKAKIILEVMRFYFKSEKGYEHVGANIK
jgi:hypothetical protein